jgi:xanthine dehydrogenase accessory factor
MKYFFEKIDQELKAGRGMVLARIIRHHGSAPRHTGTTMLILADGTIQGTIGGGILEKVVIQKAADVFNSRRTFLMDFQTSADDDDGGGMLCGGNVVICLEPIAADDPQAAGLFPKIARVLKDGLTGVLLTRIGDEAGSETCARLFITGNGDQWGSLGEDMPADKTVLDKRTADWLKVKFPVLNSLTGENEDLFIHPIRPPDILYIFGAGHISAALAPLAGHVGFSVVIIDDRPEFAVRQRFPSANDVLRLPFSEAFQRIDITETSYIVIVTSDHARDRNVLHLAISKPCAYIGMIGSRKKREAVYKWLVNHGVSEDRLDNVHCPIGLNLGARTPEEIAVSIVAELIQVRNA